MLNVKIEAEDPTQIMLLINGKRYSYASTEQINSKFKWLLSKNKGGALAYLRKEAKLLNKQDYDPNFHIELPGDEMKEKNVIKIKEDVQIPGTNIILEAGDRIGVLKEASLGVPYEVSVDYVIKDGRKISTVRNKNGVGHLPKQVIEEGDSYEIEDLQEFGNGQICFTIESYDDLETLSWRYSILAYDSKKDAIKDGWRL